MVETSENITVSCVDGEVSVDQKIAKHSNFLNGLMENNETEEAVPL